MPEPTLCIAHVMHRLYLAGAEVLAAALARRLRDRYRFVFICLDEVGPLGEELRAEGFPVLDMGRRPGVDLSVARRIQAACRDHAVDLLHAHQYTPFFYAAASRGVWRRRPKVLFTEHGRHYPDYRRPKRILANRFLLRKTDRVTAVGAFVKQALVNHEGIRPGRIEVILNGIDPGRFCRSADEAAAGRQRIREALGLDADQPMALQVARFHPVKDHATSVRAWAQASAACPRAVLVLVGDGEERAKAEQLAAELDVSASIRFLGVRSDIPDLMDATDVFVLSSVSEGISVTLLEAMGAARAICATAVGGNGEVVEHEVTGLLSPRGDAQGLAANLIALLRDEGRRAPMGEAGRARLMRHFTESRMHADYARVYDAMLTGGRGSAG